MPHLFAEGAILQTRILLIIGCTLISIVFAYHLISLFDKRKVPARMKPVKLPSQAQIDSFQNKDKIKPQKYSILDMLTTNLSDWERLRKKYDELNIQVQALISSCEDLNAEACRFPISDNHLQVLTDIQQKCRLIHKECEKFSVDICHLKMLAN